MRVILLGRGDRGKAPRWAWFAGAVDGDDVVVVVDAANVVGSRPDGWWRDRPGAAGRLLQRLAPLPGATVDVEGRPSRVAGVVVVLEGQARRAVAPAGSALEVVLAAGSGDDAVVEVCHGSEVPLVVVTADRGLRARLPEGAVAVGPRWLDAVLD